jgi:membrane protein YdbS with pleckstrin-like domain
LAPTGPVRVSLFGDAGMDWRPVSPRLATVRLLVLGVVGAPVLLASVLLAVLVWSWLWLLVAVVLLALAAAAGVVVRQVPAITWAEGGEELVIRRGRLFRTLVSVPYGRLQFVDVQSGPLQRRFGMATVELHTASPGSGAQIPGLPTAEAEALRTRLAARGESQRAGL